METKILSQISSFRPCVHQSVFSQLKTLDALLKTPGCGRLRAFWQRSVFSVETLRCYDTEYPQHSLLVTEFADNLFHTKHLFFINFVWLALLVDVVVQKECCDSWSVWF